MTTSPHDFSSTTLRSLILLSVFFALSQKVNAEIEDTQNLRLELVQVVFRHGDRTPEKPYYNDPNINETFHPYGWDALDTAGRQSSYQLGKYLKRRYGDFIMDYDRTEVKIWSTSSVRTNMCAQLVAAGLFPPIDLKWDVPGSLGFIWQPTAVDSTDNPLNNDYLIQSFQQPCPAYMQEIARLSGGPPMQAIIDSDPELYEAYVANALQPNTAVNDFFKYEIVRLYSTMSIEETWNLTIPDWAKPFYPDRMKAYSDKIFHLMVFTEKMIRLRIGAFLEHLIAQMDLKERGSKQKMWLYSGHDHSVSNLGLILGLWQGQLIDFSSALLVELYSNAEGRYFVKVFFHNDTSKAPMPMTVSGCRELCPLNQFRKMFARFIPVNQLEECFQLETNNATSSYSRLAALIYIAIISSVLQIIK